MTLQQLPVTQAEGADLISQELDVLYSPNLPASPGMESALQSEDNCHTIIV